MAAAYYLSKLILCSGLLFLYYQLALKNKLFHAWNRFYLLGAVILSLLIPLWQLPLIHVEEKSAKAIQLLTVIHSADAGSLETEGRLYTRYNGCPATSQASSEYHSHSS